MRSSAALLLATSLPVLGACTGDINGIGSGGEVGAPSPGSPSSPDRPPGQSAPPPAGSQAPTPGLAPGATCRADERGPIPRARVWRLTPSQYANTIKKTFGVDVDLTSLPADGVTDDLVTRFATNSEAILVGDRLAMAYRQQAETVATKVVAGLAGVHTCATQATAADSCVRAFAEHVASAAFRRPASKDELDRLTALYKKLRVDVDGPASARGVVTAILQSPSFLYRTELGSSPGPKSALTAYEIASQVSYLVADSPPDAELLAAAGKNELATAAAVKPHVERLLKTPEARAKVRDFFESYLHLDTAKEKDSTLFPTYDAALSKALTGETMTFVEKTLFEGGSIETLFNAQHSYVNAAVAKHYGMTGATGTDFQRAPLPAGRQGLLSHASVVAALSNSTMTSPVHRGLFYLQNLLCRPLLAPPADAQNQGDKLFDPSNPNATEREKWSYFQKTSPSCAACHNTFHPLGLGLENFDPIGRRRESVSGKPIDASVQIAGVGPGVDGQHQDGLALARAIIGSDVGRACFAMQYATYAQGRTIGGDEQCRLQAYGRRLATDMSFASLLLAMVEDEAFFVRSHQ